MDIENIKKKFRAEKYRISEHGEEERRADKITYDEIEEAVEKGEIIEEYPGDPRGASCLILGFTSENKATHLVCGNLDEEKILIVTTYRPDPKKWIDFRKRREED